MHAAPFSPSASRWPLTALLPAFPPPWRVGTVGCACLDALAGLPFWAVRRLAAPLGSRPLPPLAPPRAALPPSGFLPADEHRRVGSLLSGGPPCCCGTAPLLRPLRCAFGFLAADFPRGCLLRWLALRVTFVRAPPGYGAC
eukprot:2294893-Alexandrium_andersonii.AAC.1